MDGNKVIYKTYKGFRNHCIACEIFYHRCLGHVLVYLYDPQPEVVGNFQYLLGNQVVESDNNNNGEGVARMPHYLNR